MAVTEQSLHNQLKEWYAAPGDQVEAVIGDYIIDVVKDGLLVEIQTRNFSAIKRKLHVLVGDHRVRLVYPVAYRKHIIRHDRTGREVSRRRSPKRGRVEELFYELYAPPKLLAGAHVPGIGLADARERASVPQVETVVAASKSLAQHEP